MTFSFRFSTLTGVTSSSPTATFPPSPARWSAGSSPSTGKRYLVTFFRAAGANSPKLSGMVEIEKRRLKVITEPVKGPTREEVTQQPAFVLTMSIKNTSSDLDIFPMDPAFTRKGAEDDKPITRLVVNKQTVFAGGWILWPPDPDKIKKRSEVQQKNDYEPLRPNETREYVVFTEASAAVVKAVEGSKEPLQWRVEVRRGPVAFRGKEIPVTAIVGVDFKASDVQ